MLSVLMYEAPVFSQIFFFWLYFNTRVSCRGKHLKMVGENLRDKVPPWGRAPGRAEGTYTAHRPSLMPEDSSPSLILISHVPVACSCHCDSLPSPGKHGAVPATHQGTRFPRGHQPASMWLCVNQRTQRWIISAVISDPNHLKMIVKLKEATSGAGLCFQVSHII